MNCWLLLCLYYYSLQPKSPGKRKEEKIDQHPRKCLQNVHSFHVFLLYKVYIENYFKSQGQLWISPLFLLQKRNAQK
jgi:hypothetical protein